MTHKLTRLLALMLAVVMTFSMLLVPAEASSFRDVADGSWYAAAVEYVNERGWMAGVSETSFAPNAEVTRGMMVTVLARLAGAETDNDTAAFADTAAGKWYTGAAAWAAENGIVAGIGGGRFAPARAITRQDLCVMIFSYLKALDIEIRDSYIDRTFSDADSITGYAVEAVRYCLSRGIITGFDDGSFRPKNSATRAQLAQILMRLDLLTRGEEAPTEPMPAQSFDGSGSNGMGVAIDAPEGALPEDTEMTVSAVIEERSLEVLKDLANGNTILAASNITFTKNGESLQPQTAVQVQLSLADLQNAKNPAVVHVKHDGTLEYVDSELISLNRSGSQKAMTFEATDFSVYAVIDNGQEGDNARLTVRFWFPMTEEELTDEGQAALQIAGVTFDLDTKCKVIKEVPVTKVDAENDLIDQTVPDSTIPEISNAQMFCGWFLNNDYGEDDVYRVVDDGNGNVTYEKHDIVYIREAIENRLLNTDGQNHVVQEGDTFEVYAMIYYYFDYAYVDENGETTLFADMVFSRTPTYTLVEAHREYTPQDRANYRFLGWKKTVGDNTLYENGDDIPLTGPSTVIRAQVQKGYWLMFEENPGEHYKGATYTAPVFCPNGIIPTGAEPADPSLAGYTFEGWYKDFTAGATEAGDDWQNKFTFSGTIPTETTLKAKWKLKDKVPYTVVVWTQNIHDLKTADDADKTYDYLFATTLRAVPNTPISELVGTAANPGVIYPYLTKRAKNSDGGAYYINTQPDNSGTWKSLYEYKFNGSKGEHATYGKNINGVLSTKTKVEPNGSTVINVFYDRVTVTYQYYVPIKTKLTSSSQFTPADGNTNVAYSYYYNGEYYPLGKWSTSNTYGLFAYSGTIPTNSSIFYVYYDGYSCQIRYNSSSRRYYFYERDDTSYDRHYLDTSPYNTLQVYIYATASSDYSKIYKLTYSSTASYSQTGLYGQPIDMYGDSWTSDYRWHQGGPKETFTSYETSFHAEAENNFIAKFYGTDYIKNVDVYHYLEGFAEGDYPTTTNHHAQTGPSNAMTFRTFTGFNDATQRISLPSGVTTYKVVTAVSGSSGNYSYTYLNNGQTFNAINENGTYWTDWLPDGQVPEFTGCEEITKTTHVYGVAGGKIEFRYSRTKANINYLVGGFFDGNLNKLEDVQINGQTYPSSYQLKVVTGVYYDDSLDKYDESYTGADKAYYDPSKGDIKTDDYVFEGWYLNPDCSGPKYSFTGKQMELNGVTLYARFVQKQYRVFLNLGLDRANGQTISAWNDASQELTFRVNYMAKISGGQYLEPKSDGYELVGWFMDPGFEHPFSFDTKLNDSLLNCENYNKMTDYTDTWNNVTGELENPKSNSDGNRNWITKKITIYAKWRKRLEDANGINVEYHADQQSPNVIEGVFEDNTDLYKDPRTYRDNAVTIGRSASEPEDNEKKQFLYWQLMQPQGSGDNVTYVPVEGETYYPGDPFEVPVEYAHVVTKNDTHDKHGLIHIAAQTPTCINKGQTEYWYCFGCKKFFSDADCTTEISRPAVGTYGSHNLEHVAAVAVNYCQPGNIEYWHCTVCGKYFNNADGADAHEITQAQTVIAGAANHNWGEWQDGGETHYHICSLCHTREDAEHTYDDGAVTTAPTEATAGVRTYTCTACSHTKTEAIPALGFTIRFTVPTGTAPAALNCRPNGSVTLPGASEVPTPTGYTFVGWVLEDYSDVPSVDPSKIYTGTYRATASVTFKALYSHVTGNNVVTYELVTQAPSSFAGEYVITFDTAADNMQIMKGLGDAVRYETASNGGNVTLSASGMTLSGTTLTNVDEIYVFTIAASGRKYSVRNNSTGTYLVNNSNGYLTAYSEYGDDCLWTLTMTDDGVKFYNNNNTNYPYMVYSTNNVFGMITSEGANISLWKKTQTGSTVYTTGGSGSGSVVPAPAPAAFSGKDEDEIPTRSVDPVNPVAAVTTTITANVTQASAPEANKLYLMTFVYNNQRYVLTNQTVTGTSSSYGAIVPVTVSGSTMTLTDTSRGSSLADFAMCAVADDGNWNFRTSDGNYLGLNSGGYVMFDTFNNAYKSWRWNSGKVVNVNWTGDTSNTLYVNTTQTALSVSASGDTCTLYEINSETVTVTSDGGTVYQLVRERQSNWAGQYVITFGYNESELYALKGLSGGTNYQSASSGGAVALASTGMTLQNYQLSNVNNNYVFTVAKSGSYYTIRNNGTGTYLTDYDDDTGILYAYDTANTNSYYYPLWQLIYSTDYSYFEVYNTSSYATKQYLGLSYSNYFAVYDSATESIYFWKQTSLPASTDTTNSYTVRYVDYNGKVLKSVIVEDVSSATAPSNPSREGYTFTGWSEPVQASSGLYTITAQYQALPVVTFKDGDTVLKTEPVPVGGSATPPTDEWMSERKPGYIFLGWEGNYENVTHDETVNAIYVEEDTSKLKVTFQDWDGTKYGPYLVDEHDNAMELYLNLIAEDSTRFTRDGFELTGFDEDLSDITTDVTAIAQYRSISSKTYTVRLDAVYGPRTPLKETHVTWYADNDIKATKDSESVIVNANINIFDPITTEEIYVNPEDETDTTPYSELFANLGYTFLGWARLPEINEQRLQDDVYAAASYVDTAHDLVEQAETDVYGDPTGNTVHRIMRYQNLNENDLWLVYHPAVEGAKDASEPYFTVREPVVDENNQTTYVELENSDTNNAFKYIAANEKQPYHGLYAVWKRDVFYVLHSSTGVLEAVSMPVGTGTPTEGMSYMVGTANLVNMVNPGYLYGGYYTDQSGDGYAYGHIAHETVQTMADAYTASTTATGWTAVANVGAGSDEATVLAQKTVSADFKVYDDKCTLFANGLNTAYSKGTDGKIIKDENNKPILSPAVWNMNDAESVNGRNMTPVSGKVYYLKEVPSYYLSSQVIFTYDELDHNKIIDMWLISVLDDGNYSAAGFYVNPNSTETTKASTAFKTKTSLSNTFTLVQNPVTGDENSTPVRTNIDSTKYGLKNGPILATHVTGLVTGETAASVFTMLPAWTTKDGIEVYNNGMTITQNERNTEEGQDPTPADQLLSRARSFDGTEKLYIDMSKGQGQGNDGWLGGNAKIAFMFLKSSTEGEWGNSGYVYAVPTGDGSIYAVTVPAGSWDLFIIKKMNPNGGEWGSTGNIPFNQNLDADPFQSASELNGAVNLIDYFTSDSGNSNFHVHWGHYPKPS